MEQMLFGMNILQAWQVNTWEDNHSLKKIHEFYEKVYNDRTVKGNRIKGLDLIKRSRQVIRFYNESKTAC
jgi:hypothetical protein